MSTRDPVLQRFLDSMRDALDASIGVAIRDDVIAARAAADRVFGALQHHQRAQEIQAAQPQRGAERIGEPFASGHANATIVGPGGLEARNDVWIGVSLVAPLLQYPDHHHAPEELYVVLSPGQWRQQQKPWHEPGVGACVYNPPGIMHAMRSGESPLLATWCLWVGD